MATAVPAESRYQIKETGKVEKIPILHQGTDIKTVHYDTRRIHKCWMFRVWH